MKKRIIVLAIITTIGAVALIGCGNNKEQVNNKEEVNKQTVQEETKTEKDIFEEEELKYGKLLNSGKTYEEMTPQERTDFVQITQSIDRLTIEFQEKYKDIIATIEATKEEAVSKWAAEKEEEKRQEELLYGDIKIAEDPKAAATELKGILYYDFKTALNDNVLEITVYPGATTTDIKVLLKTSLNDNYLTKGDVVYIRNKAADAAQEVGLIRNKTVKVTVDYRGEEYIYNFKLGDGWDKDVE